MKKRKLRCFTCKCEFRPGDVVFRDRYGWPSCKDCAIEELDEEGFDNTDWWIDLIEERFNRSFVQFLKSMDWVTCKRCNERFELPRLSDGVSFYCLECGTNFSYVDGTWEQWHDDDDEAFVST